MVRFLYVAVFCCFLYLVYPANSYANNVAPDMANNFYGDATGDTIIDAADIAQMKSWTLGLSYTYDTFQPQTSSQDWNTSDVTSDKLIDAADISALKSWTLGFSVSFADKPWVISNENLPLTGNALGVSIPFQINLAGTVGIDTFGRAGLPVIAQIDAVNSTVTGSLQGRTCAPLAGSRDQSALAGAQCALSVTITDWYGAAGPTKGLTETGTYGLGVTANGPGTLQIVFSTAGMPSLDVPAVTVRYAVAFPGYSISGKVHGGALSGVTITLSGAGTGSAVTDAAGNYSFAGLSNGVYNVTPSLAGFTFNPTGRTVTISGANVTDANFGAIPTSPSYTISGTVTGAVQAGVKMTLSGNMSGSTFTDSSGDYSFTVAGGRTYTVTPFRTGYIFNPVSTIVNVTTSNVTGINFVATASSPSYTISGKVTYTGFGFPTVNVALSGTATGAMQTDAAGNYSFVGLANGSYTITPNKGGYAFSPPNSPQTVSGADITGVNFTATGPSYNVFGIVTNISGMAFVPQAGVTVTLNTSPPQSAVTDLSGNYTIPGIPNGRYTATPSLAGTNAVFYPPTPTIRVSSNFNQGFSMDVGFDVSGTVSYSGSRTGWVYVNVVMGPGSPSSYGTAITSAGAFTIRGVPRGTYILSGYMDILGFDNSNASDPIGNSAAPFTVVDTNISGLTITLRDPTPPTPVTPSDLMVIPGDNGAVTFWTGDKEDGREIATSYKIYWGTDSGATNGTPVTVSAHGSKEDYFQSIADGAYYYKISALVGTTESLASSVVGPVTVGPGSGPNSVSGTVYTPVTPTGPLLVGLFLDSGGGPSAIYATMISSPSSSQAWSIAGVPDGTYSALAFVDMNNNGIVDAGDYANIKGNGGNPVVIVSGDTSGVDQTLPGNNAVALISTQHGKDISSNDWYTLSFGVMQKRKLPAKVTLTSGPNVPVPMDLGNSFNTGNDRGLFSSWVNLTMMRPGLGDTYTFDVTYTDSTTETLTGMVTTVLDCFAQSLGVTTTVPYSNTVPLFTWAAPASPPPSYLYEFSIQENMGPQIWYYPNQSSGMPSSQTSLLFNVDGMASQPSLTPATQYNWSVTVKDPNGNQAMYMTTYTP